MSSGTDITALALQDILESIADSLNDAQESLRNMAPYDAFGRPNTIYQLPYLDFSLQVTSEYEEIKTGDNQVKRMMRFAPAPKSTTSTSNKTQIFSTISGRFVATTPNEGLPQTIIEIKMSEPKKKYSKYEVNIDVLLENAAGEKLVNSKIEINFDIDTSNGISGTVIASTPTLNEAEMYTDIDGKVSTIIKVPAADYDKGITFVFAVNVGTVEKLISISK